MSLFKKKPEPEPQRPTKKIGYPDGVAIETEKGYYFIKNAKRYKFPSERVFNSWRLTPIVSSESACAHLPLSKAPMGFRDGTLVSNFADAKIYLISGGKRRLVTNPTILDDLSLDAITATVVSQDEILLHNEGEELS